MTPRHILRALTIVLLLACTGFARASQRADAVLLVNSTSPSYSDAQRFIRPYLDNFGVPYTVLDIAGAPVGPNIGDYALIIVGHRRLDPGHNHLDAGEEANIVAAVQNGAGLVNFDNDLSPDGTTARYQFVQNIFGFGYVAPPTGGGVTFPASAPAQYITARHGAGETITTGAMTLAGISLPPAVVSLADVVSANQPFVAATTYGQGRAVQFGSYEWMSTSVKGPVFGLDDLVWRSLVWAARKPFVMQGLPNFLTMRVDDAIGGFGWVQTANQFGLKPWLGLFYHQVSEADATLLSTLVNAGQATASVHAMADSPGAGDFFYFDHYGVANFNDATVTNHFDDATNWHSAHSIPVAKFVAPHYYELGTNVFGGLQTWGVQFLGVQIAPGGGYDYSNWLQAGPYRLFETGPASTTAPGWYADYVTVPGHPEFANSFFNCVTEIRDDAGYEWYPTNDVAGSIGRGTRQSKRAFDSMALATLFTHEYSIQPILPNNWSSILSGITSNLASYNPIYVTMDYACQYVRATRTSDIASSVYDPATRNVTTSLTGAADIPTKFYLFTDNGQRIVSTFVDAPAFSGSAQVVRQALGPVDHIVVTPAFATVGAFATRLFQAQAYDSNNLAIPDLTYSWSAGAGGTIDQSGLFTAGGTPGVFTDAVTASVGAVAAHATVQVSAPVLDHFGFAPIVGTLYARTPFSVRITAYDRSGAVMAAYTGPATLSDVTGTIAPTLTGSFTAGVWSGTVTIRSAATGVTITAADGAATGTSGSFDVLSNLGPLVFTFNCWEDNHQDPVLVTTTDPNALDPTDGQWTEFWYQCCRPYPAVFAAAGEEAYGLPVMRFYTSGVATGTYEVRAKLYTNSVGRDMRYFYGLQPDAPKAYSVDTLGADGGAEQFAEYSLRTVSVSSGEFSIYVLDAALLTSGYPFFGWDFVRLVRNDATCDGIDDDADGSIDEDYQPVPTTCGLGPCASTGVTSCVAGQVHDSCTPGTPAANDAICNGIDDDCDGSIDEDYVAAPITCGVGACARTVTTSCVGGQVNQPTCTPGTPAANDATCNGIDDDCDGSIDEDYVPQATTCGVGACAASGMRTCVAGAEQDSCTPGTPAANDASCNGIDDDCDGSIDEDYVPQATTCGIGACAASGMRTCVAGVERDSCTPGTPAANDATCNGIDDDCDGSIDEDYVPRATTCGVGACAAAGMRACVAGVERDSCTPGTPAENDVTCDGIDDDCDGSIDEDYVPRATTCGIGACARTVTTVCVNGHVEQPVCTRGTPAANDATCDGIDDDCDGSIDEDYVPHAVTCGIGACAAVGVTKCDSGVEYNGCTPGTPAANDATCDGIDDDCDGSIDEDFVGTPITCGVGACARTVVTQCVNGHVEQPTCTPGTPAANDATCNGIDDDCDGSIDEDYVPRATTCGIGACTASGMLTCVAGAERDSCAPGTPAANDATCNGIDDDCDGSIDEDYVPRATSCGVGGCTRTGATVCVAGQERESCTPGAPQPEVCNGVDDDCDGTVPANEADADGDGVRICGGDCNDADPTVWFIPGEVRALVFNPDQVTLSWASPAVPGGVTPHYDVIRSDRANNFTARAICIGWDDPATSVIDSDLPANGRVFFYLIRAENSCGRGSLGQDSAGSDRMARSCPVK